MNQKTIPDKYFEHSKELIVASSKYCAIKSISANKLYEVFKTDVLKEIYSKSAEVKYYSVDGFNHYFIIKKLEWDTEFFQRPMYRMLAILYSHENYNILEKAISIFKEEFLKDTEKGTYCFIELPSEANILLQTLTFNGFRIVESRLHHYLKDIQNFNYKRFSVREADINDVKNLSIVASNTRNKYDRFHSDIYIPDNLADKYLGKFAQETVNGFADMVLVPNETEIKPNALFAVNLLKDDWFMLETNISQLVLAAVDPHTCKGWYEKLLSEICYYLKENDVEYLVTNTQTTNKAPIHVNEKLGFKYSHTSHILTISNI